MIKRKKTTTGTAYGSEATAQTPWLRYYNQLNNIDPTAVKWQLGGLSRHNGVSSAMQNTEKEIQKLNSYTDRVGSADKTQPQTTSDPDTAKKQPMSYDDYLSHYGLQEAGSGAMSYADYLARTGTDTERDYQRTVRQAETDYAKARAGYGSTAEMLARAGMTASGYSDYITGAGYAAMQGAKVAAADTKALADTRNAASYADYVSSLASTAASYNASLKQGYANYLMGEEASQQASSQELGIYVNSLAAEGADADTIRARTEAYAKAMGYSLPGDLDGLIASSVTAYAQKTPTETATEKAATDAEAANLRAGALEIVNAGTENSLSGAQIRQRLEQAGYSNEIIDSVMTDYSDRVWLSLKQNVGRTSTLADMYPEEGIAYTNKNIDTWISEGELTEAQGAELKAMLEQKRVAALNAELDNSITDEEVISTINNIVTLNRAGDITDEDVRSLMSRVGSESVRAVIDKSQQSYNGADKLGEPVVELLDQYNDIGANENYYTKAGAEAIRDVIADSLSIVDIKNAPVQIGSRRHKNMQQIGTLRIAIGGSNTYEDVAFTMTLIGRDEYSTFDGRAEGLYSMGGKLYYFDGTVITRIKEISERSVGSPENAETLMDILRAKATYIPTGAERGAIKGAV